MPHNFDYWTEDYGKKFDTNSKNVCNVFFLVCWSKHYEDIEFEFEFLV
jgi:hypothetical protein